MRYGRIAKPAGKAVFIAAAWLFVCVPAAALFVPGKVQAQQVKGSHIEVMVCPRGSQSGLHIQAPVSDSLVATPTIQVKGSVQSISQIDFYVDDVYNNSVGIGLGEASFASDVSLNPGTHTIKLSAIDSCEQETHTDSIVVTYQPQLVPAAGQSADTELPASPGDSNANSAQTADAPSTVSSQSEGGIHLPPTVQRILNSLGVTNSSAVPGESVAAQTVKASSAMAGLVLLAGAPILLHTTSLAAVLRRLVPFPHIQLILELAGAVLVIMPFVA
jgi:hypothetical protein